VARKFLHVPELIVGFDTETTGLDVSQERAISYGFCAYQYGQPTWIEQFYVIPDRPISEGARRVHGLSVGDIEAKRDSQPVYSVEAGLVHALEILRVNQRRDAYFVGANLVRFDLEMFRRSYESIFAREPDADGLRYSDLQTIDVIEQDLLIEPSRELRPRRSLGHLCAHYGVKPGGHDALNDARATVEVFLEQVLQNNAGQMALDLITQPVRQDSQIRLR
jgi:DNA polymerase III epsilon subunit-like protein